MRQDGGAWSTIATGLTDLEYEATGLDSSSDYDFQGIDILATTSTESNVVAVATAETPPGVTAWRYYAAGAMYLKNSTLTQGYTYTVRVVNTDPEPVSEMVVDLGTCLGDASNLVSLAYSVGGSGYSPGTPWQFLRFDNDQTNLVFSGNGSINNPDLHKTVPVQFGAPIAPGGSVLFRYVLTAGLYVYSSGGFADEIPYPAIGKRIAGDYGSTPELIATNPPDASWSVANYSPIWYAIRFKRSTPRPMLVIHGDSVSAGARPTAAVQPTSGYNYCMRVNAMTDKWRLASMAHGGTDMATSQDRTAKILAMHTEPTHFIVQSWSGNGSPVNVDDCVRIKANIIAMETAILAAGKKFLVATLKPHGGTISTQGERDAYWYMVDWCTTRYGVRHLNLSQVATLSADGGMTLLNSEDNTHFNGTGQQAQAVALKPLIDAALAAEGYEV
jgi:hypothetical protein